MDLIAPFPPVTFTGFRAPRPLARVIGMARVWRERMRARAELSHWEDRDLRDAGLTREMAAFEVSKPFWRA